MFFVLRRYSDKAFLSRESQGEGNCIATMHLNNAKLFKLQLEPELQVNATEKVTTGGIICEVVGEPRIPAGLHGRWEIVPVDLRLA